MKILMTSLLLLASLCGTASAQYVLSRRNTAQAQSQTVYKSVEQMPMFPGGDATLMKWIKSHLQYPKSAARDNIQGRVVMQFVVTSTGNIGDVKVIRSVNEELDREAIRVCKSLPKFVPGRQNGQPVSVWYTLPVTFRLSGTASTQYVSSQRNTAQTQSQTVYKSVEQMPMFPGGDAALMKWIKSHLQYPKSAARDNIQGRVVMQFVVTSTGNIGDVKVIRSVDEELDREAIRVCKSLPKFVPGRQNGQPVSVWYTLPVTFRLSGTH